MGKIWGIIPSAGVGSRIQPLAFSKELLPVGSCRVGSLERPRAISEYLIERMVLAGVKNICMVIGPSKADIIKYYSSIFNDVFFTFIVQNIPRGLCDAIFKALPLLNSDDSVIVGLPDTLWFPADALCQLTSDHLSFLLFPVDHPENYDAVEIDEYGFVNHIHVKKSGVTQRWVWGAFKLPVTVLNTLYSIWCQDNGEDEYFGTLVNKYLMRGGRATGMKAGSVYIDVGTVNGYRDAISMLSSHSDSAHISQDGFLL